MHRQTGRRVVAVRTWKRGAAMAAGMGSLALAGACFNPSGGSPSRDAGIGAFMDASFAADGAEGADGGATEAGGADARSDASGGPDATPADASPSGQHPATGFTQVVVDATEGAFNTGQDTERGLAMALDENDDPMFAYIDGWNGTTAKLEFVRWDATAGAFATPLQVDVMHDFGDTWSLAMAYDPGTHEVGIAYAKGETNDNWTESAGQIWLATMKAPATSFTLQPLSVNELGSGWQWDTGSPSIAMGAGQIDIAFWQGPYPCGNCPEESLVAWFLSSTSSGQPIPSQPPEYDSGGFTPQVPDAGGAPHAFTYTAIPYSGDDATPPDNHKVPGYADPRTDSGGISVAIDSTGAPGVAFYESPVNSNTRLLFWRPGMSEAVVVTSSSGIQNDAVDVTLAFEGTRPRLAGHLVADTTGDYDLTFVSSSDGVTWTPAVHMPDASGALLTGADSALALDGHGTIVVASNLLGGNGGAAACGTNPYLSVSADDGTTWTPCGADTTQMHGYYAYSINAAFGASRRAGKLAVAFQNTESGTGTDKQGIVYWQQP